MARDGHSWLGWEAASPTQLALRWCGRWMDERGIGLADAFDTLAALDRAIDATGDRAPGEVKSLLMNAAARREMHRLVRERRDAGAPSDTDPRIGFVDVVVTSYGDELASSARIDFPGLVPHLRERSPADLERAAGEWWGEPVRLVLMPGLPTDGARGSWAETLASLPFATKLEVEPWTGDDSGPDVEFFAATSPAAEVREALRRGIEAGAHWDEIEWVVSDPSRYVPVIDELAHRLVLPVTLSTGIDTRRLRLGRWISSFLRWMRDGLPVPALLELIEAGALSPEEGDGESVGDWVRLLRGYPRVSGTDGYRWLMDRADADERHLPGLERTLETLSTAAAGTSRSRASGARIAGAVTVFLDLAAGGDEAHEALRSVLRQRAERIGDTLDALLPTSQAIQRVEHLIHTRVARPSEGAPGSWTSRPGHLHVTDLSGGGLTGRRRVFLLGLDSERVARTPDPIAPILSRTAGSATLSFPGWSGGDGRSVAPSPSLLRVLRTREGDDSLGYDDLRERTRPLRGAIPSGPIDLDASDAWLRTLHVDGVLRPGREAVEAWYPWVARGARSFVRRAVAVSEDRIGWDGGAAIGRFSASALEDLGRCPRRFFYRHLLRLRTPPPLRGDRTRWLDPADRGTLLHTAYEEILEEIGPVDGRTDLSGLAEVGRRVLERLLAEEPGAGASGNPLIVHQEAMGLEDDVAAFCELIRFTRPFWVELEVEFGSEGTPAVEIEDAEGGRWSIAGRIDRVDRTGPETARIVDYKTGASDGYSVESPFDGGRRIQHWLYLLAAEALRGEAIDAAEYHFPSRRGRATVVSYERSGLEDAPALLALLGQVLRSGLFHPTDDSSDCRSCDFQRVCRARVGDFGGVTCERVARVRAAVGTEPALELHERIRSIDD